jgi:hypothetical protein
MLIQFFGKYVIRGGGGGRVSKDLIQEGSTEEEIYNGYVVFK